MHALGFYECSSPPVRSWSALDGMPAVRIGSYARRPSALVPMRAALLACGSLLIRLGPYARRWLPVLVSKLAVLTPCSLWPLPASRSLVVSLGPAVRIGSYARPL